MTWSEYYGECHAEEAYESYGWSEYDSTEGEYVGVEAGFD